MAKTNGEDIETAIATVERPTSLQQWIEVRKDEIEKALPKGFDIERMERILIGALRENPNLAKCTPISFISGMMQSIQLGLEPNTILGHAYLIPMWNSKKKVYEVSFQRGYRGLLDMAYRTREFKTIYAQEVYSGDSFDYEMGTESWIKHRPADKPKTNKKGEPIVTHVYAIYKKKDGGTHFVVWSKDKLEMWKHRYSPAVKKDTFSPWNVNEISMYRKTTLKDLLNYADISIEFRKNLQVDGTVKTEFKPNMLDTVKPIYEFDPKDISDMEDLTDEDEKKKQTELKKKADKKAKKKGAAEDALVDQKDLTAYYVEIDKLGFTDEIKKQIDKGVKTKYKVASKKELTRKQLSEALQIIVARSKEKEGSKVTDDFNEAEKKGEV